MATFMVDELRAPDTAYSLEAGQLKRLEILSISEAATLVLLVCVAVPAKHVLGWPLGSRILGPIHGMAFLAYLWTALQTVSGGGWSGRDLARLFTVAFLPFGGFYNIAWLRRKAKNLQTERVERSR